MMKTTTTLNETLTTTRLTARDGRPGRVVLAHFVDSQLFAVLFMNRKQATTRANDINEHRDDNVLASVWQSPLSRRFYVQITEL